MSNPGASPKAIQFHYDVGNDFYKIWLDETMTYSSALWDKADTLEQAQLDKLDYHIEKSEAKDCQKVLDIGCGWGATLNRLTSKAGVSQGVGLTLSDEQANHINKQGWPGVEVNVESWSDHDPKQQYDAIISVGAFEHFAKLGMTTEEKIEGYRNFFQRCYNWLPEGGCLSLQTMSYENSSREDFSPFFASQVFPESDLPRLSEIAIAIDRLFEVVTIRNDRQHYARTSLEWRKRLLANREAAAKVVSEETIDVYDKYLHLWAVGFHVGSMGLLRLQLRKLGKGL